MSRRVVITGLGTISGLGVGMSTLWEALCAGRSCLKPLTRFDATGWPCKLGGEVENFSAKDHVPKSYRKAVKVMARDIELAIGAAKDAVHDAKLITRGTIEESGAPGTPSYPGIRMGCHIGAGLIAAEDEELAAAFTTSRRADDPSRFDLGVWGKSGMESLTPLWLLKYLPNMLSCHVTIIHGCAGPSNTITCSEASGLLSIGESLRVIERGDAELCFSGGAESKLNPMSLTRLDFAKRLAHTRDETDGSRIVRPFDPQSPGGLLGEGGGIVILEAMEAAQARGVPAYAEIVGFGAAHSPMRSVVPDQNDDAPDEGFEFAVLNALDDAEINADTIDAIVVLGSGVRNIDLPEAGALERVFGPRLPRMPLVTLGPNIGNCSAGIGGVMAAVGAKCVQSQRLPARLNTGTPVRGVDAGPRPALDHPMTHVLVASSSMGGQNAAMILRKV